MSNDSPRSEHGIENGIVESRRCPRLIGLFADRDGRVRIIAVVAALAAFLSSVAFSVGVDVPTAAADEAPPIAAESGLFHPMLPVRVVDSRRTSSVGPFTTPWNTDTQREITVAGTAGVPADAEAVILNVTGVSPRLPTYLTVWPAGEPRPVASNLNLAVRDTRANLVMAKLGVGGRISIYNHLGAVDVVVDVVGWYGPGDGSAFTALDPVRAWDTRSGPGAKGRVGQGVTKSLTVAGTGGVPTNATAVVMNVTAINATLPSYVTVWPAGHSKPYTSNLNLPPGDARPNLVVAQIGDGGRVSFYNNLGAVDLAVDVVGYFAPTGDRFNGMTPTRLWDSRNGIGPQGRLGESRTATIPVAGVHDVPSDATAVVLNVTGVSASWPTYMTVWPSMTPLATVSNLNLNRGETVPNLVVAKVGPDGKVSVFNHAGDVHVVVDIVGWFAPGEDPDDDPDGTTTTTAPDTTTTTDADSTTSTTNPGDPSDPDDGAAGAWRFDPATMVIRPGSTIEVRLVHSDDNGVDDDEIAQSPTLEFSKPGVVSMTSLGDGRFSVTAGSQIDSVIVGGWVAGMTSATPLMIAVAEPAVGVKALDDSMLVFPQVGRPDTATEPDLDAPYYSDTGVGPFGWHEITAILETPADESLDGAPVENQFPLIVLDTTWSVGDLVYSTGDANILGELVSARTEVVGDHALTLFALELRDPALIFDDFAIDITSEDLDGVGVSMAEVPDDTPQVIEPELIRQGEPDRLSVVRESISRINPWNNSARNMASASVSAAEEPGGDPGDGGPQADPDEPGKGQCIYLNQGELVKVAIDTGTSRPEPFFKAGGGVVRDFDGNKALALEFSVGYVGKASLGASVTVSLAGSGTVKCHVVDLPSFQLPTPVIGPFITGLFAPELKFEAKLTAQAGPTVTMGITCTEDFDFARGFRYNPLGAERWKDLSHNNNKQDCSRDVVTKDSGIGGPDGIAATASLTATPYIDSKIGIKVGGPWAETIRATLPDFLRSELRMDNDNWNVLEFITGDVRFNLKMAWANTSYVLSKKESPAVFEATASVSIGLDGSTIKWLTKKLRWATLEITLPKFEAEFHIFQLFRGIKKGSAPPEVSVHTSGATDTSGPGDPIVDNAVSEGDWVRFEAKTATGIAPALIRLLDLDVDGLVAYVDDGGTWKELPATSQIMVRSTYPDDGGATSGPTVVGTFKITREVCDLLGQEPKTIAIVTKGAILFVLPTPGYATDFQLSCVTPHMDWDSGSLEAGPYDSGTLGKHTESATLRLYEVDRSKYTDAFEYKVLEPTVPWIKVGGDGSEDGQGDGTMVPATFEIDQESADGTTEKKTVNGMRAEVPITIDCEVLGDRIGTTTLKARLNTPEALAVDAAPDLSVEADCRTKWVTIAPGRFVETGGTAIVRHAPNMKGESWSIGGGGATYTPSSGVFDTDEAGSASVEVEFHREPPRCKQVLPEQTTYGSLSSRYVDPDDAGFELFWPEKSGGDCGPEDPILPIQPCVGCGSAYSGGDPHLKSFDGVRFDMQVDGEYRYVVPDPDVPLARAPEIHVQHSYFGTPASYAKTIGAVAVRYRDHVVEFYRVPEPTIVIDGVGFDPDGTTSRMLESDFIVNYSRETLVMSVGGLDVSVSGLTGRMTELYVKAPLNTPIRGILGSPDNDPSDDLRAADGHVISVAQALAHGYDFFTFTESWRVTDPAKSLFSIPLDTFDAPVAPFDPTVLAPYVEQVQEAFADLEPVCGGLGDTSPTSYAVISIALEVYAGTPLDEAMRYTCDYSLDVSSSSLAESLGYNHRMIGMDVHVTAPGLTTCDATIATNTVAACSMSPDGGVLALGGVPDGPPTFEVVVTHPITGEVIATGSGSFATKAVFGGQPVRTSIDVRADDPVAGSVTFVGTITKNGVPITTGTWFRVDELDADGNLIWRGSIMITPDAGGNYQMTRIAHPNTAEMTVTATVGTNNDTVTRTVEVAQPNSATVVFDVAYTPAVVTLGGAWEGVPAGKVDLVAFDADGRLRRSWRPDVVVVDGHWSYTVELPQAATRLTATALVAAYPADNPSVTVPNLVGGERTVDFDVVFHPVSVSVSGHIMVDGTVPGAPVPIVLEARDTTGVLLAAQTRYVMANPATGAYATQTELPQATTSVTATLKPVTSSVTWRSTTAATAPGLTTVTIDADVARQVVTVAGRLRVNGEPVVTPMPVTVTMLDVTGNTLGTASATLVPDASGNVAFDAPLTLPFATTDLRISAKLIDTSIGTATDGTVTQTFAVDPMNGNVAFDFDLAVRIVTIEGTFTSADGPFNTYMDVTWKAGGEPVGGERVAITPGVDGHTTLVFVVPLTVEGLDVSQQTYQGISWIQGSFLFGENLEPTITWDGRPRQLNLSGTIDVGGVPLADGTRDAVIQALDVDGNPIAYYSTPVSLETDASGHYEIFVTLREELSILPPIASWRMLVTAAGGPDQIVDLGVPGRGVSDIEGDVSEVAEAPLTINFMTLRYEDHEDVRVEAISWRYDVWNDPGPWTVKELDPDTFAWAYMLGGEVFLNTSVPTTTTFVRVTMPDGYTRTVEYPSYSNTIDEEYKSFAGGGLYTFDPGDGYQVFTGTITGPYGDSPNECFPDELPIALKASVTIYGYPDMSSDITLSSYPIFPDPVTGEFTLTLPTPPGALSMDLTYEVVVQGLSGGTFAPYPTAYGVTHVLSDAYGPGHAPVELTVEPGCGING